MIHTHLTSAICCSRLFIVGSTADANPLDIIFEASGFIAGAAESAILGNVKARTVQRLFCEYFEHNLYYYARNLKTMDAQHYVAGPVRKRPKRLVHMAVADDAKQPEKRVPGAFLDWAAKPSFSFDEIFLPLIGKSR